MTFVPYQGSTNIRCHCKKTQIPDDLACGVCTPLDYFHTRAEQEIIFEYEYSHVGTTTEKGVAYPEENLQYNRLIHQQI